MNRGAWDHAKHGGSSVPEGQDERYGTYDFMWTEALGVTYILMNHIYMQI